jgi:hypothetical protein
MACQMRRYWPISRMPRTPCMPRAQLFAWTPSATVYSFLRRLGMQAYSCGAILLIERPPIHWSSQKHAVSLLPRAIVDCSSCKEKGPFLSRELQLCSKLCRCQCGTAKAVDSMLGQHAPDRAPPGRQGWLACIHDANSHVSFRPLLPHDPPTRILARSFPVACSSS